MANIVKLQHDPSRNAQINRLFDLLARVSALETQGVKSLQLELAILREVNAMSGHHEKTINHTNREISVEIIGGSWQQLNALPTPPIQIEAPDPLQQEIFFPTADPVRYTQEELLDTQDDQEASPPSIDPDAPESD